ADVVNLPAGAESLRDRRSDLEIKRLLFVRHVAPRGVAIYDQREVMRAEIVLECGRVDFLLVEDRLLHARDAAGKLRRLERRDDFHRVEFPKRRAAVSHNHAIGIVTKTYVWFCC